MSGDAARVERVVTRGTFSLDGETFDVDNNVWLVGDDEEVLVVDAAHDARAIHRAIAGRRVTTIVCTHAHNDYVGAAPNLSVLTGCPTIEASIRTRLLTLPGDTVVHTGHGQDTTIAAERATVARP
ncbi:MBL fold metallo-hydrolase [Streptomyces griseosporeus]|uniref:MBL fold metallo-hydrolase n=1 Tax=Streptomyces griseosporeus TaxID=1910 RepID=UPI0036FCE3D8